MSSVVTDEVWLAVLTRDEFMCLYCNSEEDLQPAHYIARSHGGSDEEDNIMTLCNKCHRKQTIGKLHVMKINGRFFFKEESV
jgi:5-methylcytosine-specific restriction endonuclease McrA